LHSSGHDAQCCETRDAYQIIALFLWTGSSNRGSQNANRETQIVVADPASIDGLEYCYLAGEPGPVTTTRVGFEVDGVEVKVREDFAAAFVEWRSWYRNPGA
jgi:hypothetical protein